MRPARPAAHELPRSPWRDVLVFAALACALTLLFALTPLDLAAARLFYRPGSADPWPFAHSQPWSALYRLAPALTGSLVLIGLGALLAGVLAGRAHWSRCGIFVLLTLLLGPGLLVNGVFKDHWERPRPRDVVALGGASPYVIAPLRGPGGASFPCGHCSVGFLYALGWWVWRRRRPSLALASAVLGGLAGLALGLGRMAAGGHFLSDVLWSALIALGIAHVLYHYVLRLPITPRLSTTRLAARRAVLPVIAVLGGLAILFALFVAPHGTALDEQLAYATLRPAPQRFEFTAPAADVELTLVDQGSVVRVHGELHGFGVPWGVLRAQTLFDARPLPALRYVIEQRGAFTDLDNYVAIRLPVGQLRAIRVRVGRGSIRIVDVTREQVCARGLMHLELQTGHGRVQSCGPHRPDASG